MGRCLIRGGLSASRIRVRARWYSANDTSATANLPSSPHAASSTPMSGRKDRLNHCCRKLDAQHFFKLSGGRLWPLSSGAARSARSRTTTESLRPSRPEIARVRSVYRSSSRPAPQMSTAHPLPHFHTHHLPTHSFVPYSADLCRASLSRKSASRVRLRNIDRLILVWLYRFFPSILNANRHNQAGNGNPLAPARLPSLLALEVSPARRTSED